MQLSKLREIEHLIIVQLRVKVHGSLDYPQKLLFSDFFLSFFF